MRAVTQLLAFSKYMQILAVFHGPRYVNVLKRIVVRHDAENRLYAQVYGINAPADRAAMTVSDL